MLASEDIRLVEETARELHARGQEERARAVETVLAVARSTAGGSPISAGPNLSPREAARALSLSHGTIQRWVAAGDLPAHRIGRRTMIRREELLKFLDGLRRADPTAPAPEDEEVARRQHQWVMAGLPLDKVTRLDALHGRVEDGERLSRAERAEMTALQHELSDAAARRLEEWIKQLPGSS